MWKDEIVEEIRRVRESYAKSFNYDIKAIIADLQKKQTESDREMVKLPVKRRNVPDCPNSTPLVKPSAFLESIRIEKVDQMNLFKFTDELQERVEELLDRKKVDSLSMEETSELEAIGELDRIFTHINAMLTAQK